MVVASDIRFFNTLEYFFCGRSWLGRIVYNPDGSPSQFQSYRSIGSAAYAIIWRYYTDCRDQVSVVKKSSTNCYKKHSCFINNAKCYIRTNKAL